MITHDFHCPIPLSTVRVSVILGGDSFTVDLPSAKLATRFRHSRITAARCRLTAARRWRRRRLATMAPM